MTRTTFYWTKYVAYMYVCMFVSMYSVCDDLYACMFFYIYPFNYVCVFYYKMFADIVYRLKAATQTLGSVK